MRTFAAFVFSFATLGSLAVAQPDPGHSHYGEAFDEGPRQFARLVGDTGAIDFQVANCSEEATRFINQGIGQLHGFLNYESERSFRHAAYLDDDCVMAFWGIAMANAVWMQNTERAVKIVEQARRRLTAANTDRERLYIQAIEALGAEPLGMVAYATILRQIWRENPSDLDAKAFFVQAVWQHDLYDAMGFSGGDDYTKTMHIATLAGEILAENPMHPVHHYVIHMWDQSEHFANALDSADRVGFVGSSIAHMWHMAGHIYSHAQMPFEKWWSQEAAARVDHDYMREMRVFPFLLHNHAHNNEWLSRTLMELGNFGKALQLTTNMLAQPRHPQFNRADQYQHLRNGAARTLDVIERGHYWQLGVALFRSPFLRCEQFVSHEMTYQSCLRVGKLTEIFTGEDLDMPNNLLPAYQKEIDLVGNIVNGVDRAESFRQLQVLEHLSLDWGLYALVQYGVLAERADLALIHAATLIDRIEPAVPFLLLASNTYAATGDLNTALDIFLRARSVAQEVDETAPMVEATLKSLRNAGLPIPTDWQQAFSSWRDVHVHRPNLSDMGPLLWQEPEVHNFQWVDKFGTWHDFHAETQGRPALLVLLLNECPLCDEQYALLNEQRDFLEERGIALVAVTSQAENMDVYRRLQAFDDFESLPIHGLYIVNANGKIVWQDLSAEAFMDVNFVMAELDRALHPLQQPLVEGRFDDLARQ